MFHILPQLQAKRADFLTVMLTGSLHQRRGLIATPPETQEDGPREDDVTKSESDSLEQSQDGPPSTLLAIDPQKVPRDPGSVADVDLDQEDISKTLVLFSPGDMRKSQSDKEAMDPLPCVLEKNQQPSTKYCDGGIISLSQQKYDPLISTASPTSPPVTNMQERQPAHEPLETQSKENVDRAPGLEVKQETTLPPSSAYPFLTKNRFEQELSKNQCGDLDDLGISCLVRPKNNPSATVLGPSGSTASPPFTKVERTFIHIAETTHLNIMSSRVPQVQGGNHEVYAELQCEVEPQNRPVILETGGVWSKISSHIPAEEIQEHYAVNAPRGNQIPTKGSINFSSVSMGMRQPPEKPKDEFQCGTEGDKHRNKSTTPCPLRSRSRIPILVSEDGAAADPSLSWDQNRKWSKHQDFTRLVLERQRQALNSRTSSSISSDEPRRASETLSTTEEDTHQSDDSSGKVKQEARERGAEGWSSRIPRPVTPIKRAPAKLLLAIAKSTFRPDTTTHTTNTGYVSSSFHYLHNLELHPKHV